MNIEEIKKIMNQIYFEFDTSSNDEYKSKTIKVIDFLDTIQPKALEISEADFVKYKMTNVNTIYEYKNNNARCRISVHNGYPKTTAKYHFRMMDGDTWGDVIIDGLYYNANSKKELEYIIKQINQKLAQIHNAVKGV